MKKKCKVLIDSLSYVKGFKWLFVPFLGFICLGIVLSNISPIVYGKMIDAIADKNIDKINTNKQQYTKYLNRKSVV